MVQVSDRGAVEKRAPDSDLDREGRSARIGLVVVQEAGEEMTLQRKCIHGQTEIESSQQG